MQLKKYRKKLLALRDQLREAEENGGDAEESAEPDQTRMGRLSRMDAVQAQAMSEETGRRRREKLRQIEAALERIDEEEFGECRRCARPIAEARLDIDPTVRLCIDCAAEREST